MSIPLALDTDSNEGKARKNADVELWRFLGIVVIMIFHFYQTGVPYGSYHFASGWMFTDMFFYITGYYTYKHFYQMKAGESSAENIGIQKAIRFTTKRFQKYFPYVLSSTGAMYALVIFHNLETGAVARSQILHQLLNVPLELLCLTSAIPYGYENGIPLVPLNAPLWFISATLCVLPIFLCLCAGKKSGVLNIALFSMAILGLSVNTGRTYTNDLIRALCGLSVGAVLFLLGTIVFHDAEPSKKQVLFGHAILLIVAALTYYNEANNILVRFLLIVGLFFIQSEHKCFWRVGSRSICRLGDISLSLFVWHWPVATFMKYWLIGEMSLGHRMAIYIALSFTVALVFYYIKFMIFRRKETVG